VTDSVCQVLADATNGKCQAAGFHTPFLHAPLNTLLEEEVFITTDQYDAIGRVTESIDADGNTHTPAYYTTNWLKGVALTAGDNAKKASPGLHCQCSESV